MNRILRRRIRSTVVYVGVGAVLGPSVGVLTGLLDGLPLMWPALRGIISGVMIGGAVGAGEEFLLPYASRRLRFRQLNLLRFGAYLGVMQGTLLVINVARLLLGHHDTALSAAGAYVGEGYFVRDLAFTVIATLVLLPVLQLRRLHHASELWRLVTGRYYYPREENLVFLFVDLAGSTATAEKLGHIGFSTLLRDLFADLSEPILAWRGRVYQHAGDGVIVTWTTKDLERGAAMHCFFEMVAQLESHREHYERRYGLLPTIRGAVHAGPVVTTWVGEAKKELAYHGDTLNATARMQDACKGLGAQLLVSQPVRAGAERIVGLRMRSVGEVELKGKEAPATLYAVEREIGAA
jgi:adenylate cyclase